MRSARSIFAIMAVAAFILATVPFGAYFTLQHITPRLSDQTALLIIIGMAWPLMLAAAAIAALTVAVMAVIVLIKESNRRWRIFSGIVFLLAGGYLIWVAGINYNPLKYRLESDQFNQRLSVDQAQILMNDCMVDRLYEANDYFLAMKSSPFALVYIGYTPKIDPNDLPYLRQVAIEAGRKCGPIEISVSN